MTLNTVDKNDATLAVLRARNVEIGAIIAGLRAFCAGTELINSGQVCNLEYQASPLKQISDFAFGDDQHAA